MSTKKSLKPKAKKVVTKKVAPKSSRSLKKKVTSSVSLTFSRDELEFLRDLFGLTTPVKEQGEIAEGNICQMLAGATHRASVEETMWTKIVEACECTGVVLGDSAPSYAVSAHDVPTMYIYKTQE